MNLDLEHDIKNDVRAAIAEGQELEPVLRALASRYKVGAVTIGRALYRNGAAKNICLICGSKKRTKTTDERGEKAAPFYANIPSLCKPCTRLVRRPVHTKKCSKCRQTKDAYLFSLDSRSPSGLQSRCRVCAALPRLRSPRKKSRKTAANKKVAAQKTTPKTRAAPPTAPPAALVQSLATMPANGQYQVPFAEVMKCLSEERRKRLLDVLAPKRYCYLCSSQVADPVTNGVTPHLCEKCAQEHDLSDDDLQRIVLATLKKEGNASEDSLKASMHFWRQALQNYTYLRGILKGNLVVAVDGTPSTAPEGWADYVEGELQK